MINNARAAKHVPVFTDKTLIVAGSSVAEIEGAIHEFEEWSKRTGSFRTFFRHHAVVLANGKIAVDSLSAVPFIEGTAIDPYDASTPCPPSVERLTEYNSRLTRFDPKHVDLTAPGKAPETIVVSPELVENEDAALLESLTLVFGGAPYAEKLIEKAGGSGLAFRKLLIDKAATAKPGDRALVLTRHDLHAECPDRVAVPV